MEETYTTKTSIQYPKYWTEETIKIANEDLKTLKLTPEDHFAYLMTINRNAEAVYTAKENIEKAMLLSEKDRKKIVEKSKKESLRNKKALETALEKMEEQARKKAIKEVQKNNMSEDGNEQLVDLMTQKFVLDFKQNIIKRHITLGFGLRHIAEMNEVSLDFVIKINEETKNNK